MSTSSFSFGDWEFVKCEGCLSSVHVIEEFEARTNVKVPEITFQNNFLKIRHRPTGVTLMFTPHQALVETQFSEFEKLVESLRPTSVEVKDAGQWRGVQDMKIACACDWCYTSVYRGHVDIIPVSRDQNVPTLRRCILHDAQLDVANATCECLTCTPGTPDAYYNPASPVEFLETKTHGINYDLLRRRDPILFYSTTVLYEDELHDNGVSQCIVKSRVMESCWFVLLRMFVRVDGVLVRIRETRIYHEFKTNVIVKETRLLQADLHPHMNMRDFIDADVLSSKLPVTCHIVEYIDINKYTTE